MSEPRRGLTRRTYPDQAGPSFLDRMIPGGSGPGTAPTVPDASPVPGVPDGSHVLPRPPKAGRIAGPKYDRELLQQLRDAVLFLRQRGRPTMGLIDVLDEAITQWLERQKQAVNDGNDFPPGGNLR